MLPQVLPVLECTLERYEWNRWTLPELVQGLRAERYQLWAAREGEKSLYVVTEIQPTASGPELHIVLGGGGLDEDEEILKHLGLIEEWATAYDVKSVIIWGRLGWKKKLAKYGYQLETAMYRRPLTYRMN